MFKRILVAFKFAQASELALTKGAELARVHGAELHVFHAMDYLLGELDESDPNLVEHKAEIHNKYSEIAAPIISDLGNVNFKCLPADPAMAVCKIAKGIPADLIMLGCHQLPEKMCLGRLNYIGMTILEKAPCPVMLVPLCE